MTSNTSTATDEQKALIRKASSSVFNYWFGYVANVSLTIWLASRAFSNGDSQLSIGTWAICLASGFVFWTLSEYFLHKVLYHEVETPIKVGHDLHHDEPRSLLGVPWWLTTIILVAIYYAISYFVDPAKTGVVMAAVWAGYILYCFLHHSTHHFNFKNSYFQSIRRNHLIHHAKGNVNWGITTDLWDRLFRTKA